MYQVGINKVIMFLCVVVDLHVAVNNIKPFSVVMEIQWVPFFRAVEIQ